MQMPDVSNIVKDEAKNITYDVRAYRTISKQEAIMAIRIFRSSKQGKRLKANSTCVIMTVLGCND
jgi:hypothetical protein